MKQYTLPISTEVGPALSLLRVGLNRVGVTGRAKGLDGVFGCVLETSAGKFVEVRAQQKSLEYKFEVFSIDIKVDATFDEVEEVEALLLSAPVEVLLLQTEDWLDRGIPCKGALGQDPIMQYQGKPGQAPESAVAACRYFGGIELRGSNRRTLTIATLPFPYAIHVSAIAGTGIFDRGAYIRVAASVA